MLRVQKTALAMWHWHFHLMDPLGIPLTVSDPAL